jgi:hypothetical protein
MKTVVMIFVLLLLGFFSVCSAFMEKGEYISGDM